MKKFILFLFLVSSFQFFSAQIKATTCSEWFVPLVVEYQRADAVFVGKIKKVKMINPPEDLIAFYSLTWRKVEFEIQKSYKGLTPTTKTVSLLVQGFDDEEDFEAFKVNQSWIVFSFFVESKLHFGSSCNPSGHLKKASDLAEYEKVIFGFKDKQAIMGTIVDDKKIEGIQGIEITLENDNQRIILHTDQKGSFYFPAVPGKKNKISIKLPLDWHYSDSLKIIDRNTFKSIGDLNSQQTVLIYEVILEKGFFDYTEIDIFYLKPKA